MLMTQNRPHEIAKMNPKHNRFWLQWLSIALLLLMPTSGRTQPPSLQGPDNRSASQNSAPQKASQNTDPLPNSTVKAVALSDLDALRDQIAGIDEQLKADVTASLQRAEGNLASIQAAQKEIASITQAIDTVSQQLTQLQQTKASSQPTDLDERTTEQLQSLVTAQTTTVASIKKLVDESFAALTDRIAGRQKLQERTLESDTTVASISAKLGEVDGVEGVAALAAQLELRSQIHRVRKESELARAKLALMDAEDQIELPRLRDEHYKALLAAEQKTLLAVQSVLNNKRGAEAKTTEDQTRDSALGDNPLLRESFEFNLQLAQNNKTVTDKITTTASKLKTQSDLYGRVFEDYRDANNRVKTLGLSDSIGAMLRNQQQQLPNELNIRFAAKDYERKLNELQFQLYDLQQQKQKLSVSSVVKEIRRSQNVDDATVESLSEPIEQLVQQRSELISKSLENYQEHFDQLVEQENREKRLATLAREFREFINIRILWIRSNEGLWKSIGIDDSDYELVRPGNWAAVAKSIKEDWAKYKLHYLFAIALACAAIVFKPRLQSRVDELGEIVARGRCQTFGPTFASLLYSSIIAVSIPLAFLAIGWRIHTATAFSTTDGSILFGPAMGKAIMAAAWFAIPVELLRRFCRHNGLAHRHFAWTDEATGTIRKNLRWISPVGALVVFGIVFFGFLEVRHQNDLIERVLFIFAMALLWRILRGWFHPKQGVFRSFLLKHQNAWVNQLSKIWYAGLIAIPVSLGLLAFIGYYYTAFNLAFYVFLTFVFGLTIETVRALLLRLLLVRRRRAHVEVARRRRQLQAEKLRAENSKGEKGELAAVVKKTNVSDADLLESFDVRANAIQSRKLISLMMLMVWIIGVWMIWTDVLPALKRLDGYPIWPPGAMANEVQSRSLIADTLVEPSVANPSMTDSSAADVDSASSTKTVITIRDAFKFLFIAALTFLFSRNLPALMEMTFLQQLPVEPSVRYAIKTIFSYLVVLVGVMLAFWSINIGWAQVQWLAAALTFGLAFGLQEIFANFVAGIILLFERPIRIGDVVTIDNVTGVVTKIRIRATTICNWDRQEYVIPNKEFITGRVLNWTLSDQVSRIVIEIGVAYGTDLEKAKALLLEICENHPDTMSNPATRVTFEKFADSSLLIMVRTFVPDIDSRLSVIDQLHTEINNAFNDAGISIAFPQLDVNMSSSNELPT